MAEEGGSAAPATAAAAAAAAAATTTTTSSSTGTTIPTPTTTPSLFSFITAGSSGGTVVDAASSFVTKPKRKTKRGLPSVRSGGTARAAGGPEGTAAAATPSLGSPACSSKVLEGETVRVLPPQSTTQQPPPPADVPPPPRSAAGSAAPNIDACKPPPSLQPAPLPPVDVCPCLSAAPNAQQQQLQQLPISSSHSNDPAPPSSTSTLRNAAATAPLAPPVAMAAAVAKARPSSFLSSVAASSLTSSGTPRTVAPSDSPDGVRMAWEASRILEESVETELNQQTAELEQQSEATGSSAAIADNRVQALKARVAEVAAAQELAVEREEFEEAARLDAKLSQLHTELEAVTDVSSAATLVRGTQQKFCDCTEHCAEAVERCVSSLQAAESACLSDAAAKVTFEGGRTAGDVARVTFEAERLSTERQQVTAQLTIVAEELQQVEQKVDQLTESDREVRALAVEELAKVETEIEELRRALAEKEAHKAEVLEAVQLCDLRIAEARGKFQKQLQRLRTSQAHLEGALSEVSLEIQELNRTKSAVLESRLSANRAVETLLQHAQCIRLAAALLRCRALVPLRLLCRVRTEFLARTEEPSKRLSAAAAALSDLRVQTAATADRLAATEQEEFQLFQALQEAESNAKLLQEKRNAAVVARNFLEAARLTASMHAANSNAGTLAQRREALAATRAELLQVAGELEGKVATVEQQTANARRTASEEVDAVALGYRKTLQTAHKTLRNFLNFCETRSRQLKGNTLAELNSALADLASEFQAAATAPRKKERQTAQPEDASASSRRHSDTDSRGNNGGSLREESVQTADDNADETVQLPSTDPPMQREKVVEEKQSPPPSAAEAENAASAAEASQGAEATARSSDDCWLAALEDRPCCAGVARVLARLAEALLLPLEVEMQLLRPTAPCTNGGDNEKKEEDDDADAAAGEGESVAAGPSSTSSGEEGGEESGEESGEEAGVSPQRGDAVSLAIIAADTAAAVASSSDTDGEVREAAAAAAYRMCQEFLEGTRSLQKTLEDAADEEPAEIAGGGSSSVTAPFSSAANFLTAAQMDE